MKGIEKIRIFIKYSFLSESLLCFAYFNVCNIGGLMFSHSLPWPPISPNLSNCQKRVFNSKCSSIVGTVRGGTQHQVFKSTGKKTFAQTSSLTLLHNSVVHVTVVAINWAGLRTVSYSDPILLDFSPPLIYNVLDGDEEGLYNNGITYIGISILELLHRSYCSDF